MAKARILVVDDEEVARLSMLRILQLDGYEVTAVGGGESALRELDRSPYDLMILDLHMHGFSGMDVLTRTSEDFPNLKVVILTAYGSMDTAIQALRFKVTDYLIKPSAPAEIIKSVEKALQGDTAIPGDLEIGDQKLNVRPKGVTIQPYEQTVYHVSSGEVIDCMRRIITWSGGVIHLTPTEAKIIGILLENNSLVVRHSEMVRKAYGYRVGSGEAARILRPIISRLNTKLEKIPGGAGWIHSIRGSGYLFEIGGSGEPSGSE